MREKAEQGIYPSRPPIGYRNNKLEHTIEIDPENTILAKRMFELYVTGRYSLATLRKALKQEFGRHLATGYLARLLKNPFYYDFAFGGLLRCAYDDCSVTAEIKKNRYTYYHCTGFRGKCELLYFREEEIGNRLGAVLKNIHIPDEILMQLRDSLLNDTQRNEAHRRTEVERLNHRLGQVRNRIEQPYLDKLDGKISEEFWSAKSADWTPEEQQILMALLGLKQQSPERPYDAVRALELAK